MKYYFQFAGLLFIDLGTKFLANIFLNPLDNGKYLSLTYNFAPFSPLEIFAFFAVMMAYFFMPNYRKFMIFSISGAVGNFSEKIFFGKVTDFITWPGFDYTFNLADVFLFGSIFWPVYEIIKILQNGK